MLREEARVVYDSQQVRRFGFGHQMSEAQGRQVFFSGTVKLNVDDGDVHKMDLGQPIGQFAQVSVVTGLQDSSQVVGRQRAYHVVHVVQ